MLGHLCLKFRVDCYMKIGIDIRLIGKNRTGDENVVFNLVKKFAQINTTHEFKLFTDVTDGEKIKVIANSIGIDGNDKFEIISLETKNRFAWNFWTLPLYLRKNPVDVYHTQYITPFFVPHTVKILTIVHDISFNFFPQFMKFSDLFFLKTLIPLSLRRADKIMGVSKFTQDEIMRYYDIDSEKVEFMHNSIGEEFLKKEISKDELEAVREKYKLPEKFILYLGTLQPRKNIAQLVEAFARTIKENGAENLKLVICGNRGSHNYDKRIDEQIIKNEVADSVFFPGFIDEEDKVAVFRLAHVFAFPSLYEGFGIPPLEAMSQDVPVLCSNIPSLKEIAADGALFFDLRSIDDFSKKLYDISMNNDLRNELIRSGKTRINSFSWENSARKMLATYENM
ncbi:MAG: mannosyltransferase B-like protein [uncultured bacterium]|nr:MAG: mannosyltransferase B-like protein [uncultured bacterium]